VTETIYVSIILLFFFYVVQYCHKRSCGVVTGVVAAVLFFCDSLLHNGRKTVISGKLTLATCDLLKSSMYDAKM